MKKFFLLLPIFIFADVNPFNAGLNSPNPYGLTPDEKAILENKKNINSLKKQIINLNNRLDKFKIKLVSYDETINNLNDRLSALDSIISEIGVLKSQIDKLKKEQNQTMQNYIQLEKRVFNLEQNASKIKIEINSIKETIKQIVKIQNDNFNYLKNAIQQILKNLNSSSKIDKKSALKKAKAYFFGKQLNKAKELFEYTLSQNYYPATSSYYLGEIAFKQKRYKDALAYYKKSVELYPKKASFTARLLYHSGISFLKLGNKEAAKLSFQKILSDFPNSKYANLAKKELEKLK